MLGPVIHILTQWFWGKIVFIAQWILWKSTTLDDPSSHLQTHTTELPVLPNPNGSPLVKQVTEPINLQPVTDVLSDPLPQATIDEIPTKPHLDSLCDPPPQHTTKDDTCTSAADALNYKHGIPPMSDPCLFSESQIKRHKYEIPTRPHPENPSDLQLQAGQMMEQNAPLNTLMAPFRESSQLKDLETISLHQDAAGLRAARDSDQCSFINNFALALKRQYDRSGQAEDLDKAISLYREVLELRAAPHPDRSSSLNNLGNALSTRFERSGQHKDLGESILLHRDALELRPLPHPFRHNTLDNLGLALRTQFKLLGRRDDLDEAISLHQEALELRVAPHPDRSKSLNNLALALRTRFGYSSQRKDLDDAISLHRDSLDLRPAPHPLRFSSLNNLANALKIRFEQSGKREDLDEAISMHRESLDLRPAPHPSRSGSLFNLAVSLRLRFEQSGQRENLDEAILLHGAALDLQPVPHPGRSDSLNSLANALGVRFEESGQSEDLDTAVLLHREALQLRPPPHFERYNSLNNLAGVLLIQFDQSGQDKDLDEAISLHRDALELAPTPHLYRSGSLFNLANALRIRFERSRKPEDLDDAISLHRDALELRPLPHLDRSSSLNELAVPLRLRFELSGQSEDLNEAISMHREALGLLPTSHFRSYLLNNLAVALGTRFDYSGQRKDLDEAISVHQDALELRPPPHPYRCDSLYNLANILHSRFHQSGQREDLDNAIKAYQESLNALVSGHSKIGSTSAHLGRTLMDAYSYTHQSEYLDQAMVAFRVAVKCETAPTSVRFHTAKLWARHADPSHESALEAYRAAIELLPRLAMLGLDLQSRHQALTSGSDGLARDAAACAIRSGQYGMAAELLEEGRAVFWSQALQLRTPMTDLRDVAPVLETELKHISLALERGSQREVSRKSLNTPEKVMMEREASRFHRLNEKWLATLEQVRQLDGFQNFLRPRRLSTLQGAAANGPVVVLNASKTRCDALIVTSNGVQLIPLLELTFADVIVLAKLVQKSTGDSRDTRSNRALVEDLVQQMPLLSDTVQLLRLPFESRYTKQVLVTSWQPDNIFQYVLAVLWESVVKPVIRILGLEKSDTQNLWWCPTGPFAFLPMHAAGIYHTEKTESVSDYVISSYTPTISALLGGVPLPANSFKMMVVIQPDTPGQKSLPHTIGELRRIEDYVSEKDLIKLIPGYVGEVISHLPEVSIAHFACHGQQNATNPLESALILQDGWLKVSHIMQQSMPNASLAFLSACETAMGDESLPDEVIHLGATLLFAGFRGVVATMWSILDADGPEIADIFYQKLFQEVHSTTEVTFRSDSTQAARALHLSVAKLRSEGASFIRWVPFIHLGR